MQDKEALTRPKAEVDKCSYFSKYKAIKRPTCRCLACRDAYIDKLESQLTEPKQKAEVDVEKLKRLDEFTCRDEALIDSGYNQAIDDMQTQDYLGVPEWRDISTASAGTWILGGKEYTGGISGRAQIHVEIMCWNGQNGGCWKTSSGTIFNPTHWMPLPNPPVDK